MKMHCLSGFPSDLAPFTPLMSDLCFAGLRIRCFVSESGSGYQISLDPDPDPVSAKILEQKKSAERSLKVIYRKKTYKL